MYGMVNKAIQSMVIEQYGEEQWRKIFEKSGIDIDVFVGMETYPDEVTYKIVGAASELFNIPANQYIEMIGEYWIQYTSEGSYKSMYAMAGNDFVTFLKNVNDLHTRVGSILTELKPPSFTVTDITSNSVHLHYYSKRAGFAPMVIGLVKGLGKKFNTRVQVAQINYKDQGADHDEFLIDYFPE